jgi:hypothetical protein
MGLHLLIAVEMGTILSQTARIRLLNYGISGKCPPLQKTAHQKHMNGITDG